MPTCKECGFTAPRLQWTHFKYNCTGRFANGREYKAAYPDAVLVDPELAKKTATTLENMISKYGNVEGQRRWDEYKQKQAESNTFEYKAKKHGWTKTQYTDFNKSRSSTLENFISRHGEQDGLRLWDEYCERQRYTNSLEYFIKKYGNTLGAVKWNECNLEKSKSHDINYIMSKYEVDFSGAEEILRNRANNKNNVSELEKKFVNDLLDILGDIKYTYKTKQFCIWSPVLNSPLFYDVTCTSKNKIIEFNGDYWHCNPAIYESTSIIKQNNMTASEVWERDNIKMQTAIDRGFQVYTVWELDYNLDPASVLTNIKKWWNNG